MDRRQIGGTARALASRPVVAALAVLTVYGLLALWNDPGGYLGTDTGAKVATLDHMVDAGTASPDVGYWAEEWDPTGDYHPLFDTQRTEDGEWVNVTTLPMLLAARPLYDLGGYRLALVLPMLGALLAALACRDLARRLAPERPDAAGTAAFWVVALASPVAVYALDFWEHAPGAGLMVAAAALLVRHDEAPAPWWPLGAGALLGVAAAMRGEAFVVTLVTVATACLVWLWRRRLGWAVGTGALAVAGFAGPWFLNTLLDVTLDGNERTDRITGQAGRDWWTELSERTDEALITWFNLPGLAYPDGVILGAVVVGLLLAGLVALRRGEERIGAGALAAAGVCYLLSLSDGLSFVSGALVASPLAVAAPLAFVRLEVAAAGRRAVIAVAALAATVVTWMFQLTGGAGPQWGGRYLLAPTLVLTTLGVVAVFGTEHGTERGTRVARVGLTGLAVAVTAFGLAWLNHRSHEAPTLFDELADRPEDVVISTNGFLVREAGPDYRDRLYLSIGRGADLAGAVEVVESAGLDTFAFLTANDVPPDVPGRYLGTDTVNFLGADLPYHRFEVEDAAGRG